MINVEEIIYQLKNSPLEEEIKSIQELIFEVHGFSQVRNRFRNTLKNYIVSNNPMVDNIENKDLTFFTNKNINISVGFFKFLLKNDKLLCIRVLFIVNPMILIKYLVKSFMVNLKLIKIKLLGKIYK